MLQCLQPVLQCMSAICAIFCCLIKVERNHKSLQEHATQNPEILGTKKEQTAHSTDMLFVTIFPF